MSACLKKKKGGEGGDRWSKALLPSSPERTNAAKILAPAFLGFLHCRRHPDARARQSMLFVRIRSAQSQAALEARHLDLKVTCDDVSRNVPPLHGRRAFAPCTRDRLAVARKIVLVPKVACDAPSITCDKRHARHPTVCPQTPERGRGGRAVPSFTAWPRCGCCVIYESLSRKKGVDDGK